MQDSPKETCRSLFQIPLTDYTYPRSVSWFALSLSPPPRTRLVLSVNAITGGNHLRWGGYRITRIKGGGIGWSGRRRKRKKRRGVEAREAAANEHIGPVCTGGQLLPSCPPSRLSPPGADPPTRAVLLCPRRARTRSSSVIDRNLSLTSLPPGAKILPGATG